MTNADLIVSALRAHGELSDSQLRQVTGVSPHQQVNQICRRLEAQGMLRRSEGIDGRIVNTLLERRDSRAELPPVSPARVPRQDQPDGSATRIDGTRSLLVLPCSGRKVGGGERDLKGPSILDLLPDDLADRLATARAHLRPKVDLDDDRLLPAWRRYSGTLYDASSDALRRAVDAGKPIAIVSGGYGLLVADEPIGTYDWRFNLADWPRGLIEDCLLAVADRLRVERVVGFCARTTGYADVVRRAAKRTRDLEVVLVSPEMHGRGGAQVLVPRALGEAIGALLDGRLSSRWYSSDGIEVVSERVV